MLLETKALLSLQLDLQHNQNFGKRVLLFKEFKSHLIIFLFEGIDNNANVFYCNELDFPCFYSLLFKDKEPPENGHPVWLQSMHLFAYWFYSQAKIQSEKVIDLSLTDLVPYNS